MSLGQAILKLRDLVEGRAIAINKSRLKRQAKEITQQLLARLEQDVPSTNKFRPLLKIKKTDFSRWKISAGRIETRDVRGSVVNVPLTVDIKQPGTWKSPRFYISGGHVTFGTRDPRQYSDPLRLTISVNGARSFKQLSDARKKVEDEVFSVLIHEVTHMRDLVRAAGYKGAGHGNASYHNDPTELRAFMQQVVDEVLTYTHEMGRNDGGWLFVGPPSTDFVERALEHSKTWDRIRKDLSRRNEKLVLKAVSRALTDEWPSLRKRYPDDMDDDW